MPRRETRASSGSRMAAGMIGWLAENAPACARMWSRVLKKSVEDGGRNSLALGPGPGPGLAERPKSKFVLHQSINHSCSVLYHNYFFFSWPRYSGGFFV